MIRALAGLVGLVLALPAAAAESPLPFSEFMRRLAQDETFVELVIEKLGASPASSAMLGPLQADRLREIIRNRDFARLDRFPTMTVDGIGTSLRLAARARGDEASAPPPDHRLEADVTEELGIPSHGPPPESAAYLADVGHGVLWGDALDPEAAARQPDGARLADVLNRLSRNPPQREAGPRYRVRLDGETLETPQALARALERAGHSVVVRDARYFANFGDLLLEGREVLTPFWMDTGIPVPGSDRTLLVPAAHSQHEVVVRGPLVNTEVAFFFGIDGEAIFRTLETRDQRWVLGREAARYEGDDALEALRILGVVIREFARTRLAHPELPFGGYYALGVCNDANAMVELHMRGATSLYPLTADASLFPAGSEVAALAAALPIDRGAARRERVERVLGSLPTDDHDALPFPRLRADLAAVEAAARSSAEAWWSDERRVPWLALGLIAALVAWRVGRTRRPRAPA